MSESRVLKSNPVQDITYKVNCVHTFLVYIIKREEWDFANYVEKLGVNSLDTQDSMCRGHR